MHPRDPLARGPQALKAVADELAELRSIKTWDDANVMEFKKASALYPDVHFARILPIVGVKSYEQDLSDQKYKGRIGC